MRRIECRERRCNMATRMQNEHTVYLGLCRSLRAIVVALLALAAAACGKKSAGHACLGDAECSEGLLCFHARCRAEAAAAMECADTCKETGRCAPEGGECRATKDEHCAPTRGCMVDGLCTAKDG